MKHLLIVIALITAPMTAISEPAAPNTERGAPPSDSRAEAFELESAQPLTTAYAIFFPSTSETERPTAEPSAQNRSQVVTKRGTLQQLGGNRWRVVVPVVSNDDGALLAVVATTAKGDIVSSDVRRLTSEEQRAVVESGCGADMFNTQKLLSQDRDVLEALLKIRSTKNEVLSEKVREQLDDDFLKVFNARERKLGLSYDGPVTASTPLNELTWRMSAVSALTKTRRAHE